jgi:hypothetical protein
MALRFPIRVLGPWMTASALLCATPGCVWSPGFYTTTGGLSVSGFCYNYTAGQLCNLAGQAGGIAGCLGVRDPDTNLPSCQYNQVGGS